MDWTLLRPLFLAFGLGLLVGLQREWSHGGMAGIRTFPLITVLGVLVGAIAAVYGGWVVAAGLLGVAALLIQSNLMWAVADEDEPDSGLTTEMAALVMFAVGSALWLGHTVEAVVASGAVFVLLQAKAPLHRMVDALSDKDVKAIVQFVLLALVVLPLLPDQGYGPYGVFNPYQIWFMVVLIVGISIAAWAAYRLLGSRRGTALTGVLGGLISSTATTVSQARRARTHPGDSGAAAFIILMASAVMFGRMLFEIGVVARTSFASLAPPLAIVMGVMLLVAALEWRRGGRTGGAELAAEAPSELRSAIAFGLLYALVLFAVAAARQYLGEAGLYVVAAISGLTDVDAITLSTAQLVKAGQVELGSGWRVILVAGLSNLVFKGGAVVTLGGRALRGPVLKGFGAAFLTGVALIFLWG